MTEQNQCDYSIRLLLCLKMKTYSTKLQSEHQRLEILEKCFGSGYSIMKHNADLKGKHIHSPPTEAITCSLLIEVSHLAMLHY